MTFVLVVDVSKYQPPSVPWGNLKADGIRAAIIQLCHGTRGETGAPEHLAYARLAGLLTGFYHYLMPLEDPAAQARAFVSLIPPDWRGRLFVDVEKDGLTEPMLDKFISAFDDISFTHSFPLGIYTRKEWWEANIIGGTRDYRRYGLWAAGGPGYDQHEGLPPAGYHAPIPVPWTAAVLEQFTGKGRLPGYAGDLDISLYRGTETEFFDWWTLAGGRTMPQFTVEQIASMSNSAATILAEAQNIMGILHPGPPPILPPVKHTMADMTGQQVINLFNSVFGGLNELTATGLLNGLAAARGALYTGPAVEDLPGLTDAQKAKLIAALPPVVAMG